MCIELYILFFGRDPKKPPKKPHPKYTKNETYKRVHADYYKSMGKPFSDPGGYEAPTPMARAYMGGSREASDGGSEDGGSGSGSRNGSRNGSGSGSGSASPKDKGKGVDKGKSKEVETDEGKEEGKALEKDEEKDKGRALGLFSQQPWVVGKRQREGRDPRTGGRLPK